MEVKLHKDMINNLSQIVYTVYKGCGAVKKKYGPEALCPRAMKRMKTTFYRPFLRVFFRISSIGKTSECRALSRASSSSALEMPRGMLRIWPG